MFSRSVYTLTDRSTIARTIKKPVFSSDYGYWLSSKGAAISLRNIVGIVLSLQSSDRAAHFGSSDHKVIRWLKASLTYEIQSQQPVRELIYHWIKKHWPFGRRDKICNSTAYKRLKYIIHIKSSFDESCCPNMTRTCKCFKAYCAMLLPTRYVQKQSTCICTPRLQITVTWNVFKSGGKYCL